MGVNTFDPGLIMIARTWRSGCMVQNSLSCLDVNQLGSDCRLSHICAAVHSS